MEILYLLIPISVVLALGVLLAFAWALQDGQFDNVDEQGQALDES